MQTTPLFFLRSALSLRASTHHALMLALALIVHQPGIAHADAQIDAAIEGSNRALEQARVAFVEARPDEVVAGHLLSARQALEPFVSYPNQTDDLRVWLAMGHITRGFHELDRRQQDRGLDFSQTIENDHETSTSEFLGDLFSNHSARQFERRIKSARRDDGLKVLVRLVQTPDLSAEAEELVHALKSDVTKDARESIPLRVETYLQGPHAVFIDRFKSADDGDADSLAAVAYGYLIGRGVIQNESQGMVWLKKAARSARGQEKDRLYEVWEYLTSERPEATDENEATFLWFSIYGEALLGDPDAMYNVGKLYRDGTGVDKDVLRAVRWFQAAGEQGQLLAMVALGVIYEYGRGVPQDHASALRWYRQAADGGQSTAIQNVGLMYLNGHGVTQDVATGLAWLLRSADAGNSLAMLNLGKIYGGGFYGVTKDEASALDWYRNSAKLDNKEAQNILTEMGEKW